MTRKLFTIDGNREFLAQSLSAMKSLVCRAIFVTLISCSVLTFQVTAQELTASPLQSLSVQSAEQEGVFLSVEDIDRALAAMPDVQVRTLLRTALQDKLQSTATDNSQTSMSLMGQIGAFGGLLADAETGLIRVISAIPKMPSSLIESLSQYASELAGGFGFRFMIFVALALGLTIYLTVRFRATERATELVMLDEDLPRILRLQILARRFSRVLIISLAMGLLFTLAILIGFGGTDDAKDISLIIVAAISSYVLFRGIGRFSFAPQRHGLRLFEANNQEIRRLYSGFMIASVVALSGVVLSGILEEYASATASLSVVRNLVSTVMTIVLVITVWRGRNILSAMIIGEDVEPSKLARFISKAWPGLTIGIILLQWIIVRLTVFSGNGYLLSFETTTGTLILVLLIPFIEMAFKIVAVEYVGRSASLDSLQHPAARRINYDVIFLARALGIGVIFGTLAWLWGFSPVPSQNTTEGIARVAYFVDAILILFAGMVFLKLIAVISGKVIISEAASQDANTGGGDEPGGAGGTRLETVLPLITRIVQFGVMAVAILVSLSVMGVNTTPLLAGAGIAGLAIGFGAQKLVQDIVSGIFFLLDDAFRIGEYLDIGGTLGTVEKISLRSLRLRHHLGAVNTVPFGSVAQISNYSRDWAIMKLTFRLPYGTDANKIRKLVKTLGQELLAHPDIGDKFLAPLKSQGVTAMEDSAMIMSVKFTTKPGDQFVIRRFVHDEIHKLFERNGIQFANREVTVRVSGNETGLTNEERQSVAGAAGAIIQPQPETLAPTSSTASPVSDK